MKRKQTKIYKIDGDKFKTLIKKKGMTVKGALNLVGMSEDQYGSIRNKTKTWSRVSQEMIDKFKSILDLKEDDFYYIPNIF